MMSKPPISRGFRARNRPDSQGKRVPPGQHVVSDFPVLSAGPTPQTSLETWTFALQEGGSLLAKWTWAEFEALPQTSAPEAPHVALTVERIEDGEVSPYLVDLRNAGPTLAGTGRRVSVVLPTGAERHGRYPASPHTRAVA